MKKGVFSLLLIFCLSFLYILSSSFMSVGAKDINLDNFTAKSLYLIDYNSGQVLYEKDSEIKVPVASIVKLMTIDLVCEEIESGKLNLDDKVIVSQNAQSMGGSQVFIEANAEYSVGDLLKSTIVSSANDASVALAEQIAGSEESFVILMNKKAHELGLTNTNYVNCTGLPASGQFSCAKDTAKLLSDVLKHDSYHKFSTIWMDTLKHPKGRESELVNTNKLIRYYEGCDGGKTGSTNEAGYCLAATAKRGDMRLIGVVLGAENGKSRFGETSQLLNYGFNNFENKKVVDSLIPLKEKVSVSKSQTKSICVKAEKDLYVLSRKGEDGDISIELRLEESVKAPVKVGDVIGKIYVVRNGKVVGECNIVSMENAKEATFYDNVTRIVKNWKLKTPQN